MNSKCKLWLNETKKSIDLVRNIRLSELAHLEKQKLTCTGVSCDEIKNQIRLKKKNVTMLTRHPKLMRNNRSPETKRCAKLYCNVGCKDTIFQDGPASVLPASMRKRTPGITELLSASRKTIFGKKKSVLKNNFYEKISAKTLKQLHKEGAISGCATLP